MGKKLTQIYPPYYGDKPYLVLCFSKKDRIAVSQLLGALTARGFRIWYDDDSVPEDIAAGRIAKASLAVIYLTLEAEDDPEFRNGTRLCCAAGCPVISMDMDGDECGKTMDLTEKVSHVRFEPHTDIRGIESTLIRTPGFSQDLLDEERRNVSSSKRKLSAWIFALTLAILAAVLIGDLLGWFSNASGDMVTISDPVIEQAARRATGGAPLTLQRLEQITTLRFSSMPGDNSEFSLFPALTTIEIPQALAPAADSLHSAGYRVVLYGGQP